MKLSEVRAICGDFLPDRKPDGKIKCHHLAADGEMCNRTNHFVCELRLHRDRQKIAEEHPDVPRLSVSKVSVLETCKRLYFLKYLVKVQDPTTPAWRTLGTFFSTFRAKIDMGQPWQLPELKDAPGCSQLDLIKLDIVLRNYQLRQREICNYTGIIGQCEAMVRYEHNGCIVHGYADAVSADGKTITEWKYAQTDYDRLRVARQASAYLLGMPKAERVIIARAKKPQQRLLSATKKRPAEEVVTPEGIKAVHDRIQKDWVSPDLQDNFTFITIDRKSLNAEQIIDEMVREYQHIPVYEQSGWIPNYSQCGDCLMHDYCERKLSEPMGVSNDLSKFGHIDKMVKEYREKNRARSASLGTMHPKFEPKVKP